MNTFLLKMLNKNQRFYRIAYNMGFFFFFLSLMGVDFSISKVKHEVHSIFSI
jgi:hypothetical protein